MREFVWARRATGNNRCPLHGFGLFHHRDRHHPFDGVLLARLYLAQRRRHFRATCCRCSPSSGWTLAEPGRLSAREREGEHFHRRSDRVGRVNAANIYYPLPPAACLPLALPLKPVAPTCCAMWRRLLVGPLAWLWPSRETTAAAATTTAGGRLIGSERPPVGELEESN